MKRANKQIQGRPVSRGADKQRKTVSRRRLLVEGLEQRQLLAAALGPSGGDDVAERTVTLARNIGTVESLLVLDAGSNNSISQAQLVPLGTGPGDFDTIDISGTMTPGDFASRTLEDVDVYAVDLEAGDILDIAAIGLVSAIDVFYPEGNLWFGAESDASGGGTSYPYDSPLQTQGNVTIAQTVPRSGRYYIQVTGDGFNEGIYTLGLRVYRPVLESTPVGTQQVLFLDFDGESFLRSEFGPFYSGVSRLSPMSTFLDSWGLTAADEDAIIDKVISVVEENFADIGLLGNNGWFNQTGTPGDFGITILNSRDHADEYGANPYVSRVIVGGSNSETGLIPTVGLASSVDVGNFDTSETTFVVLDDILTEIIPIPRTASFTIVDTISTFLGNVATHEAAHIFGVWHQNNTNSLVSIGDQGGDYEGFTGTGPDGIFGTIDDNDVDFTDDYFVLNEGIAFGREDTVNAIAFNLSTGTTGGNISGTVFSDLNRNQSQGSSEPGIAGVTVYADLDNDGVLDTGEPRATTNAAGNYTLVAAAGTVTVRAATPPGYVATTATARTVTVTNNGSADADFGFNRVLSDVTGFKWNDLNGDGIRDAGEPGIAGVYVYLDLDNDDRIDLGEPRAVTKADGSYSINFPGPGNYTIREVVEPGMLQTFPPTGEHQIVFDGTLLTDNYNFGNQSVLDFGDAPATYPTLTANNGASHGVTAGFALGTLVDAEADGQPSVGATGDDVNGLNDDDGVVQRSPLSPGSSSNVIDVTVTNTTGSTGYLSAWLDLNQDGDWNDAGEKILSDRPFTGSATETLQFSLPASAQTGSTYARFRLSPTPGAGPTGFITAGEVEDYQVDLVATPEVANDDAFDIPRGSVSVPLDVLANDFDPAFNPLTITSVNTSGTLGAVVIANDGRSVFYTPRSDTLGPDSFTYTVTNETGTVTATATVDLNVIFQSAQPIAVDDSYNLPSGVSNQTLAVLANDIPSVAGGNQIIATSATSSGGTVRISTDRQRLIYSPSATFTGTEQFTYTVSDRDGKVSTATVTVHLQPGSQSDDEAAFLVQTLANDGVTQIQSIQAGQTFKLRVLVEDLRSVNALVQGLDAAYMDLLYTDGLVTTVPSNDPNSAFPFEISFGDEFERIRTGDINTPGLLNEVGGTQQDPLETFDGPRELFTLTLRAVSPGVAEFITDPADAAVSDTVLHNTDTELVPRQIRFGRSELTIVPSGAPFTFAVDDAFPDGRDSLGNLITSTSTARLNVLTNDNAEAPGAIRIVNVSSASNGFVSINDNGTPTNPSDDYIAYRPNVAFSGVEQFSYTIQSDSGIQSTAEVTVTVGNPSLDDVVGFEFNLLDAAGNPTSQVNVGQTFQVQIMVDDLRPATVGAARGVFAAYMDLLYNARLAEPTNTTGNRLGFDVQFGDDFDPNPAVGDALIPGLINEFGTFQTTLQGSADPLAAEPIELATISFVALAPGNFRIAADPADVSPFQDTLLFDPPNTVPISQIRYDVANLTIVSGGSGEGESQLQNPTNRWDVNDDGSVSPIDALLVVNRLNRSSGSGEGEAAELLRSTYYLDVNGDNHISPVDALQVVNYLNRGSWASASGEGELAAPLSNSSSGFDSSSSSFDQAADAVFEDLGQSSGDSLVADALAPSGAKSTTTYLGSPFAGISDAEDDDRDEEEGEDTLGSQL